MRQNLQMSRSGLTRILAMGLALGLGAAPASAGFFLEGLKPFTQDPRCPDPHAMDKTGCVAPDTAYPTPQKGETAPRPDVRTTTRDGGPRK
jgi:hypothetical protein